MVAYAQVGKREEYIVNPEEGCMLLKEANILQ